VRPLQQRRQNADNGQYARTIVAQSSGRKSLPRCLMRVHLYLREFPPHGDRLISGMIKAVHGLAAGFAANGAQVTVLCEGQLTTRIESPHGYEIRCFAYDHGRSSTQSMPSGLRDYLVDHAEDLGAVVLNSVFNPSVYLVSRLLRRLNVPYIVAPHDPYHPSIFGTNRHLKWPYWYLREKPMLVHARAIQVLDFRHAEWLRALGIHTPVIEVLNGYAPEDVLPEESLEWRTSGRVRLLYLGRIDSHNKGLDILLDAFAQLPREVDAELTLQGPDWGDRASMVRRAQRLGLGNRVHFREPDFDVAAAKITAEYDVFCLPSRFEGFGLSALEAMLSGRVLLVSDIAGIAPHVRRAGNGLIIAPDVAAVRKGLLEMISLRPKWREMGLKGREYALGGLRWERIAAQTLREYEYLLNPKRYAAPATPPSVSVATQKPAISQAPSRPTPTSICSSPASASPNSAAPSARASA
jgi:glycosyltransferase involved in cell wall biosynthesis